MAHAAAQAVPHQAQPQPLAAAKYSVEELEAAAARLHAAGDDCDALAEALAGAAFLEGVPGEYRQKLRAARARLRALLAAAAKAGAASASPHALTSPGAYAALAGDDEAFGRLAGLHERLAWRMVSKPGGAAVRPDDYYRLEALTAQATRGDVAGERPMWAERGGLDFEGRARWDAWAALRGLPADKARLRYVRLLHEFSAAALYKDTRAELLGQQSQPAAGANK